MSLLNNLPQVVYLYPRICSVNYPIKHALKQMEDDMINTECKETKFFIAEVTQEVAFCGLQRTVQAWNNHIIPGILFNPEIIFKFTSSNSLN